MSKVTPVRAHEIAQIAPLIKRGLQVVREKTGETWTDDEVFDRLASGRAFLFLVQTGFFILVPHYYEGQPAVLIWIGYGTGRNQIRTYIPEIESLAREIGATAIIIQSPRPGYRRALQGWERDGRTFIRRLR